MPKKKIIIDCRKIHDYGIGEYVRQIVIGISSNKDINSTYSFYFLVNKNTLNFPHGFVDNRKILKIKPQPFSIFEFIYLINLQNKFDFFWATSLSHPIFGFNKRLITTVHDVNQIELKPATFKQFITFKIIGLYLRSVAKKSRIIFFNSEFTKERFLNYFHTSALTEVTPLGSKYECYSSEKITLNDQLQYFVILGNNRPHKNINFAIRNFLSNKDLDKFNLHIIGSHEVNITDLDHKDFLKRVIFFGKINDHDLVKQLKYSRALIFPSLYEGFGLPALEAMSLSVPVICSDIPAIREVCAEAAFYFDPYSNDSFRAAISMFLQAHQLNATSLRFHLQERSNLFSWKRCIDLSISKLFNLN